MGFALALAAKRRGAEVVLVSGPTYLQEPKGLDFVLVESAEQMRDAVISHFPQSTVVIMAAAVSDFKPTKTHDKKMKKEKDEILSLELARTRDILKEIGQMKKNKVLVGFALETDNLVENATLKLKEKNLDMVVANGPMGLNKEINQVTIIEADGAKEELEAMYKYEIADRILDKIAAIKG